MKRRLRHLRTKLPLHSYEAHPLTERGEVKKPIVIALVTIIAIAILIVLLFVAEQFVGRAYFVDETNTAGMVDEGVVASGDSFTRTVQANIGTGETTAIAFTLSLPVGVSCTAVESLLDWETSDLVISTAECSMDRRTVTFEYVTLDWTEAKTGTFDIATISFAGITSDGEPGTQTLYALDFTLFDILDSADAENDFINEGLDPEIVVEIPAAPVFSCTGDIPSDAELCTGDNTGLTENVVRTLVSSCGAAQCEYICVVGFHIEDSACVADAIPPEVVCGNNIIEEPEVCDDGNTITETACGYGTASCTLCNADCTAEISLTGATCGDGTADEGETCVSCPADAGCAAGESCDAGVCIPAPSCGDGTPDAGETCVSCPADAGCAAGEACNAVTALCEAAPTCDADNLNLCTTESGCTAVGGEWDADAGTCSEPALITQSMSGTIIEVEELDTQGTVHRTILRATDEITEPFRVYTTLRNADGVDQVFEIRRIESMASGEEIELRTDSLGRETASKRVNVFDTLDASTSVVHLDNTFVVSYSADVLE